MAGFLGKGDLYIDRDIEGAYIPAGNATKFAIDETDAEVKERVSRQVETYGQNLDTVIIPKPAKISIEIDEMKGENLAIALRGLVERKEEAADTVTDEAITAKHDKWVPLAHDRVSNVVVKDSGGTTTYSEGTDYEVNTRLGMIKALSTGNIEDNEVLKVTYDYAAKTYYRVQGSKEAEIECALILDGENQVNNKRCKVTVYQAKLRPAGEVDFLADDFVKLALEGTLITPENKTEPYVVDYDV